MLCITFDTLKSATMLSYLPVRTFSIATENVPTFFKEDISSPQKDPQKEDYHLAQKELP